MLVFNQEELIVELEKMMSKAKYCKIMMEILSISRTTAYKISSLDTKLTFDQGLILLNHFNIQMPTSFEFKQNEVQWLYNDKSNQPNNPFSYIKNLQHLIASHDPLKTKLKMTFFEVPIFYFLNFPNLFAFKLYCWNRTIWNPNDLDYKKFNPEFFLTQEMQKDIDSSLQLYNQFHTIEFWNDGMLDNTIRQMVYMRKLGAFAKEIVYEHLISDLEKLQIVMYKITKERKKKSNDPLVNGGESEIYINDIFYTSHILLSENDDQTKLFSVFDNPNLMFTIDERMIQFTNDWVETMRAGSTSLTQNNDLIRNQFFKKISDRMKYQFEQD